MTSSRVERAQAEPHPESEHPPLERGGIHDARADIGRDLLPYARRKQNEGGPDLAKVGEHRLRLLDEVHLHARQKGETERVDLLHDPRQRQDRNILVLGALGIGAEIGRTMADQSARGEHRKLRAGGGAGGGAKDRHRLARRCRDEIVIHPRFGGVRGLAAGDKIGQRHQTRIAMLAHAAGIGEHDVPKLRNAITDGKQLVHLLLVLGKHHRGAGMGEQIGNFVVERIAVDPKRHRPDCVCGDLAHHPLGTIVADQPNRLASPDPERAEPERQGARARVVFRPGDGAPDAEVLLPQRRLGAMFPRLQRKQFWKRIVQAGIGQARRGARHGTGSAPSTGSSSTSPR